MAEKTGDVWVELKVDTKAAERELAEVDRRAKVSGKKRAERAADPSARPAASGAPVSRPSVDGPSGARSPRVLKDLRRNLGQILGREGVQGYVDLAGRAVTSGTRGANFGRFRGAGAASRIGASTAKGLGAVAGTAAVVYLGARTAAQAAPLGLEFVEGLTEGAVPDAVLDLAKRIRAGFETWEANIKALYTGAQRTMEFAGAAARITGQVPGLGPYWDQFQRVEAGTMALDQRFKHFKRDDVVRAAGRTLGKMVSQSMSQ